MTLQSIPFHLILALDSLDSFEKDWNAAPNKPTQVHRNIPLSLHYLLT